MKNWERKALRVEYELATKREWNPPPYIEWLESKIIEERGSKTVVNKSTPFSEKKCKHNEVVEFHKKTYQCKFCGILLGET